MKILIVGSGHLALRIKTQLEKTDNEVTYLPRNKFQLQDEEMSKFDFITNKLMNYDLTSFSMIYILDDFDAFNLELFISVISINKSLPVTASLFNENIAPHLRAAHPNIHIINPAKIAAPKFVASLTIPIKRHLRYKLAVKKEKRIAQSDPLIIKLVGSFFTLIALGVVYFHFSENLSWINSVYFMVVTVATVGYGDINLLNSTTLSKIIGIIIILSSTLFIWLIFSLTIDRIIKKRTARALGRKQYHYKDHIILCGLGRLGYYIGEELLSRGEKIIIIEKEDNSPHVDYFRKNHVDVYIGDARLPDVLQDVNITHAKALMSVINNDHANLEIGLNGRSFNQDLRLVLRIFDESMSEKIKDNLDIHIALSMSAIADDDFLKVLKKVFTK